MVSSCRVACSFFVSYVLINFLTFLGGMSCTEYREVVEMLSRNLCFLQIALSNGQ